LREALRIVQIAPKINVILTGSKLASFESPEKSMNYGSKPNETTILILTFILTLAF